MNQKCLTTIFVPVQPLNLNMNTVSVCKNHQKPLSYYNKYKPNNEPICIDCLLEETKNGKDSNLYIPVSNLEQEYYYQKNAFFQIMDQANNMKKYDSHITNFKNLLLNYFSQFIANFLNEKIIGNLPQKKVEFCDKNNACLNKNDILNLLYKVENEKFFLENKSADVFCQLNKLQKTLLNNHAKLEKSFKDLLNSFFDNSKNDFFVQKENSKENYISKTQSNKRHNPNISAQKNTSKINSDTLASTKYKSKTPFEEEISQFSPLDKPNENMNDKKEISNFPYKININMEEEKIFEDNIIFDKNEINNSFSERKNSELDTNKNQEKNLENNKAENELEWRKKKSEVEEELAWRRKKGDEEDEICKEHKDKINKLIEQDKNKKSNPINQSFYHKNKKTYKSKPNNLNKSFQKYNPAKFNFSKKIEYKQYNQFLQKNCSKCGSSFLTTKDDEICQNCKYISDDEDRLNKRRKNKDFSKKNGKYGFFSKNFKKTNIQSHFGNKRFFGKKDTSFSRNFVNKSLIHSNSNFLNFHGKIMNSPKGFDEFKKYNNNGKYKMNKGKENYENKYPKNNYGAKGAKKYYERKAKDDFEVDLDTEEDNNANSDDKNDIKEEKLFFKTTNEISRNNSVKKNDENIMNNNQNISDCDSEEKNSFDFNKNEDFFDKKEFDEKDINDDSSDNENKDAENDDFEADF